MNRPKKILLLSHIPIRDEIADRMLANALVGDKCAVWKYPMLKDTRAAICMIKPDIVIFPEIRIEWTRDTAKLCKEWGIKVVQRRCEFGMSEETPASEGLWNCIFGNVDWQNYIDLDLVYGEKFKQMLVARGVPEEKIKSIGMYEFDHFFIDPPQIKKGDKPRVLFLGGFGYADKSPLYAAPEGKVGEKMQWELVKNDRENRIIFAQMIEQFIEKYGDKYEVGIRPHAGESWIFYDKIFGNKVTRVENCVNPIAVAWCDILIHPGSTQAYGCHLTNRPSLNYRNTNLDVLVGGVAPICNDVDSLFAEFDKTELGKSNANLEYIKKLEPYYGQVDGQAHQRAAKLILDLPCDGKLRIPDEWPKIEEAKYVTQGVVIKPQLWKCQCGGEFITLPPFRNTTKCPWCGIGCVMMLANPNEIVQNEDKMEKLLGESVSQ